MLNAGIVSNKPCIAVMKRGQCDLISDKALGLPLNRRQTCDLTWKVKFIT